MENLIPISFLAAADRLGVSIETATVVGDSVWDMLAARRARALAIGLLSGGYGQEELERAGAYRLCRGSSRPFETHRRGRWSPMRRRNGSGLTRYATAGRRIKCARNPIRQARGARSTQKTVVRG